MWESQAEYEGKPIGWGEYTGGTGHKQSKKCKCSESWARLKQQYL